MAEESLSPLSKSILGILSKDAQEDKKERKISRRARFARRKFLESNWRRGQEKIILDLKSIVEGILPINSELAVKLERCFLDGVTLMENMSATPEKIEGKTCSGHIFARFRRSSWLLH